MKDVWCKSFVAVVALSLIATAPVAGTITAEEESAPNLENWDPANTGSDAASELFDSDLFDALVAEQTEGPTPEVQRAIRALSRTGSENNLEALQNALTDERRNAGGWAFLATWALDNDRPEIARAAVAKAQELNERNPLTAVAVAALQEEDGNLAGAISMLQQVIAKHPGTYGAAARLSDIQAEQGNLAGAVAPLDAWLSHQGASPSNAAVALRVGQMLLDLNAHDRALAILEQYIGQSELPNDERAAVILLATQSALDKGDVTRAKEFLSLGGNWRDKVDLAATLSAAVEWKESRTEHAERQLEALKDDATVGILATRYLAGVRFDQDAIAEARELYETAISRAAGVRQVNILESYVERMDDAGLTAEADDVLKAKATDVGVRAYVMLSDRQLQQQRFAEALESSSDGLTAFPRVPELHYIRGITHFMMGDAEAARKDFGAAIELNPDHARAWVSLAKMEHEAGGHGGPGRHVGVIEIYKRALEASPDNAIIEIELGKVAQEEERLVDAERWYRKSLISAPSDPLAQSLLAILLADTNRLSEAKELAASAMAAYPDHHQVLFAKGRVELVAANYASAADALMDANRSRPQHGHSLAYAALALFRLGQVTEAAEVAEKALHLALRDNEVEMARQVLSVARGDRTAHAPLNRIDTEGVHEAHGSMLLTDTQMGLQVTMELSGARVGPNSVHLHDNPSCAPKDKDGAAVAGLSAGAHYGSEWVDGAGHAHHAMATQTGVATDAQPTQMHGPMVMKMDHGGHSMDMVMRSPDLPIGDLPPLMAEEDGKATYTVFVPYLHTSMLLDRSVVVHDGTESVRAYCGVISRKLPAE